MKGKIILFCVVLVYFTYGIYLYSTEPIENSEWTCRGDTERSQICEFTNFCIDQVNGPFIITPSTEKSEPPPRVNMINANSDEDMWFTPRVISNNHYRGKYNSDNDTLFVYGLYSPFHFSHYLYNGLIPLYSTIRQYGDHHTKIWLLRAKTFWNEHTKLDMSIWSSSSSTSSASSPNVHDIVLDKEDVLTQNQMLPHQYVPICFKRAIVGTGNRCSLWYCEHDIPNDDYMAFRDDVFKIPITESDPCLQSVIHYNGGNDDTKNNKTIVGILNRAKSRHITNVPELAESIVKHIPNIQVRLISFDEGCNIRSTAHLLEDVDVLIAPFGNGLGAGLFMKKKNAMMIAIDARWYSESWFYWPMTSIGIRLYSFQCTRTSCQEYDIDLVKKLSPTISATDAIAVMTQQQPPGIDWSIYGMYQKDVSRRVDVEQFIPFLQEKMATTKYENCGEMCQVPLKHHGFGGSHSLA